MRVVVLDLFQKILQSVVQVSRCNGLSEDKMYVLKKQNSQKAVGLRASKLSPCKVLERASHNLSGMS